MSAKQVPLLVTSQLNQTVREYNATTGAFVAGVEGLHQHDNLGGWRREPKLEAQGRKLAASRSRTTEMSGADIDTVLLRCQADPVLRGEYLRLAASCDGAGWHRLMADSALLWDGATNRG